LTKTASRSRFGAFVYTVAPLWTGEGTQECTQIGENGPSVLFWGIRVHCCDARVTRIATRVASGGTSAPTTMTCRRHSLGGHLPLGRENRLCTSGAAARLASSPRQQTHTNPRRAPESNGTLSLRATTRHLDYLDARKSKVSSMLTTRRQAIPGLKAYRQPPAHETIVSGKGA